MDDQTRQQLTVLRRIVSQSPDIYDKLHGERCLNSIQDTIEALTDQNRMLAAANAIKQEIIDDMTEAEA